MIVLEVALSLVLLVGCSLLARSFVSLQRVSLPVPTDHVLTLRVPLAPARYPTPAARIVFFQALLERVAALPGVTQAGVNAGLHPFGGPGAPVEIPGIKPQPEPAVIHMVSAGYTPAMGIHVMNGRLLTDTDVRATRHVAVVNDRFVRLRLEGRPALGQVVHIPRLKQPPVSSTDDAFEIVGVVQDVPNSGLAGTIRPEVYIPFTEGGMADRLVVRTAGPAAGLTRAVIGQILAVDSGQPADDVKTLDVRLAEDQYATPRFSLVLFLVFATIGLTLAVVGVYGVMSNSVAQQRHELGVRLALGAGRGTIVRMVVARGARLLLVGIAVGLVGSILAARLVAGQVWNVPAFDPVAFFAVSLILFVAGLQACLWPARRAGRIDPIIALRNE